MLLRPPDPPAYFRNQFRIGGEAVRGSERIRGVDARESIIVRLRVKWIFHSFPSKFDLLRGSGNDEMRYPRNRAKLREAAPPMEGGVRWDGHPRSSRENIFSRQQHSFLKERIES